MKQTAQFGLNQWERTDRVLMDDFNNDNKKIDAALLSRLGPIEIIQTLNLTSTSNKKIDLTSIDWAQWSIVAFACTTSVTSYTDTFSYYTLSMSSSKHNLYGLPEQLSYRKPAGPMLAVFFPGRDPDRLIQALSFPGGDFAASTGSYRSLRSLEVSSNNYHEINRQLIVLGIR